MASFRMLLICICRARSPVWQAGAAPPQKNRPQPQRLSKSGSWAAQLVFNTLTFFLEGSPPASLLTILASPLCLPGLATNIILYIPIMSMFISGDQVQLEIQEECRTALPSPRDHKTIVMKREERTKIPSTRTRPSGMSMAVSECCIN